MSQTSSPPGCQPTHETRDSVLPQRPRTDPHHPELAGRAGGREPSGEGWANTWEDRCLSWSALLCVRPLVGTGDGDEGGGPEPLIPPLAQGRGRGKGRGNVDDGEVASGRNGVGAGKASVAPPICLGLGVDWWLGVGGKSQCPSLTAHSPLHASAQPAGSPAMEADPRIPLGCRRWLGQSEEVGMRAHGAALPLLAMRHWASGFTYLLSLSFLVCHVRISIPAPGSAYTTNRTGTSVAPCKPRSAMPTVLRGSVQESRWLPADLVSS